MVVTEQLQFGDPPHRNVRGPGGDLYRQPVARRTDPDTSHAAAEDAKRNANTLRWRCLQTLKAHPEGLDDFALAALVGSQQTSAGKRRGELVKAGLVEKATVDGVVVKRPSPSGSLAIVWRAVRR